MVNENVGQVNIALSLDQSSCIPVTIVARPTVRIGRPAVTGKPKILTIAFVKIVTVILASDSDFDNTSLTIIVDPGETTALVSITIFDDEMLESLEVFDVIVVIGGMNTDGAMVEPPGLVEVVIASDDGKLHL